MKTFCVSKLSTKHKTDTLSFLNEIFGLMPNWNMNRLASNCRSRRISAALQAKEWSAREVQAAKDFAS